MTHTHIIYKCQHNFIQVIVHQLITFALQSINVERKRTMKVEGV